MTVWRVQVVTTVNGNRSTAVQGDKSSITQTYNGCVRCWCIQEPLRDTWLIRLRHSGDEWVCERVSIRHDKALMHWQVESSFSCYSSVIFFLLFYFSHILSFLINSLPAGLLFPLHCFTLSKLSVLPDSASFLLHFLLICFFFLLFLSCCLLCLSVLCVDIYSNSLTGHSGGWRCEHPSE